MLNKTGITKSAKPSRARSVRFIEGPRLQGRKQAGSRDPYNSGYHVGSVSKSGHILWMYDEDFTLEEAEVVAGNSRLRMLSPGTTAPKTLPLPPRAARRLEKFRQEGPGVPIDQPIPIHIVTCGHKFVMASSRLDEIEAYVETYNKYRRPESPAAVVVTKSIEVSKTRALKCAVYAVLTDRQTIFKVTESKSEAEIYQKTYNELGGGTRHATIDKSYAVFELPPERLETARIPNEPDGAQTAMRKEWLVVDGESVLYRGDSCGTAVALIEERGLASSSLFSSSARVVDLLRDMLPRTGTKTYRVLDDAGNVIHETDTKHGAAAFRVARGHGTVFKVRDDGTLKRVKLPPLPTV